MLAHVCNILGLGGYVMKEGRIRAVHDDDLERFLSSLGCLETVRLGQAVCHFCGQPVNLDNLECVFPHEGDVAFCCSASQCYSQLMRNEVQR